jgi:hypothetical protein
MNAGMRLLMIAALGGVLAAPAVAEERQTDSGVVQQKAGEADAAPQAAVPTAIMRDLLSAGYEIKAVTFVPHDAVKRGGATLDVDAAVYVLQKGAAMATCYTDFASFTSGNAYTLPCNEYK